MTKRQLFPLLATVALTAFAFQGAAASMAGPTAAGSVPRTVRTVRQDSALMAGQSAPTTGALAGDTGWG
ncbi:hypothetical protein ABH930_004062 [Kitasatospora sp. GAS204A]|uniref:hypothetical protein n=1 Tax=unclassified Kitasatospora TaxID=2633591 RepID=UPI0024735800|nr:hypothetical protein [Kitasatospora sp. GAS204B]MDH6120033.1 hypothetical protein [Kitasatospora sp. GAS204B]